MNVQELIDKARAAAAKTATADVTLLVVGDGDAVTDEDKVVLTFTKLLGAEWSALTAVSKPRADADLDQKLGYDLEAVVAAYPDNKVSFQGETFSDGQWAVFFATLDVPWRNTICERLLHLNHSGPASRILELGKASSGAGSKKKRNSPSN